MYMYYVDMYTVIGYKPAMWNTAFLGWRWPMLSAIITHGLKSSQIY